jgi:hypothetical protein
MEPGKTTMRGQDNVKVDDLRDAWPQYVLRLEIDELFIELTAVGYRETQFPIGAYVKSTDTRIPI